MNGGVDSLVDPRPLWTWTCGADGNVTLRVVRPVELEIPVSRRDVERMVNAGSPQMREAHKIAVGSMALAELLASTPPGHREGSWTWEDEERDIAIRLCLCCGQVGHYQETVETRIAEQGLTEGVCIGEDGRLHDGHHRVIAALHLGIERVPLETKDEADSRWRIDHGGTTWELRQFGDVHPGEAWEYVQNVRQQARDFVAREAIRV